MIAWQKYTEQVIELWDDLDCIRIQELFELFCFIVR